MKCLIFGASGQVGGRLAQLCRERHFDVTGTSGRVDVAGLARVDLRDHNAVRNRLAMVDPDIVFVPAAFTNVDRAEDEPDECRAVNVEGPAVIASTLARRGRGKLVFFSTDHVFTDTTIANQEDDPVQPQHVYGRSKAEAEERIRALLPDRHLILRTSWVYGPDAQERNFFYRAYQTLRAGKELLVPMDQYGQPTFAPDLARVAIDLALRDRIGTFHAVGPDRMTRYAFGRLIAAVFGFDAELVRGTQSESLPQRAKRPKRVWLARFKLSSIVGTQAFRSAGQGVRAMRDLLAGDGQLPIAA